MNIFREEIKVSGDGQSIYNVFFFKNTPSNDKLFFERKCFKLQKNSSFDCRGCINVKINKCHKSAHFGPYSLICLVLVQRVLRNLSQYLVPYLLFLFILIVCSLLIHLSIFRTYKALPGAVLSIIFVYYTIKSKCNFLATPFNSEIQLFIVVLLLVNSLNLSAQK